MTETLGLILIVFCAIFGRMGGMGLKPFGKGWRRFILPVFLGIMGVISIGFKMELLYAVIGSVVVFCLPYGERTPYWVKFLVGCAFIAPTILLGYTVWQIIVPMLFIILFKLSNWKLVANEFGWAIVEILTFIGVGITWARVLGLV